MTWAEVIFLALLLGLFLLPPRYDPAIRLKEWVEKRRDSNDQP